jgi:hypothetical protein
MIELIVTDKNGRVIESRAINKDLFEEYLRREEASRDYSTRWFLRMLLQLFKYTSKSGADSAPIIDTTGTSRTVYMKQYVSGNFFFNNTYYNDVGFYISVGTGTTPPTRDDYKLEMKIAEGVASVSVTEDAGIITLTAGFTWTTDQTITEIGLEWLVNFSTSSPYACRVLCDRTVLDPPITVPAGTTLTVVYRFKL